MRTIYDAKDIIVRHLLDYAKPFITGDIYRDRRPMNSDKEDIVVNTLPLTMDTHQVGRMNVNLFVPFVQVKILGIVQDQPNNNRLRELANIVSDSLLNIHGSDFNFYIEYMEEFEEKTEKANYINFRIRVNMFGE